MQVRVLQTNGKLDITTPNGGDHLSQRKDQGCYLQVMNTHDDGCKTLGFRTGVDGTWVMGVEEGLVAFWLTATEAAIMGSSRCS